MQLICVVLFTKNFKYRTDCITGEVNELKCPKNIINLHKL